MAPNIPDRWLPYKACGEIIEGTRIVCFKVPLRTSVLKGHSEITEKWDVKSVLQSIPGLAAVIDLTNTARYYDPKEFEQAGVAHRKIMMAGRIIPPEWQIQKFMETVDEFIGANAEAVIGVHCTHGLNRTGFMVCRYMRDRLGIDPREAITRFEKARGYEIERDNYIADVLGKKPPPPAFGKKHEKEAKPVGKKRSISLSKFDDLPAASEKKDKSKSKEREHRGFDKDRGKSQGRSNESWRGSSSRNNQEGIQDNSMQYNTDYSGHHAGQSWNRQQFNGMQGNSYNNVSGNTEIEHWNRQESTPMSRNHGQVNWRQPDLTFSKHSEWSGHHDYSRSGPSNQGGNSWYGNSDFSSTNSINFQSMGQQSNFRNSHANNESGRGGRSRGYWNRQENDFGYGGKMQQDQSFGNQRGTPGYQRGQSRGQAARNNREQDPSSQASFKPRSHPNKTYEEDCTSKERSHSRSRSRSRSRSSSRSQSRSRSRSQSRKSWRRTRSRSPKSWRRTRGRSLSRRRSRSRKSRSSRQTRRQSRSSSRSLSRSRKSRSRSRSRKSRSSRQTRRQSRSRSPTRSQSRSSSRGHSQSPSRSRSRSRNRRSRRQNSRSWSRRRGRY